MRDLVSERRAKAGEHCYLFTLSPQFPFPSPAWASSGFSFCETLSQKPRPSQVD